MNLRLLARSTGAILLAGCLASVGQALAQPGPVTRADPQVVLVIQGPTVAGTVSDASSFASYPTISSQAADDFVVPSTVFWHVTSVTVMGLDGGSTGSSVDSILVQFYADSGGLPGPSSLSSVNYASGNFTDMNNGTMVITLNPVIILGPGHYWFSAQPHLPPCTGSTCKTWLWTESPVVSNAESAWKNPGGGFGTPCTNWQPRVTVCGRPLTSTGKDLAFELDGTTSPVVGRVLLPIIRR